MANYPIYDALFDQHVEKPSLPYRAILGPPVSTDSDAFSQFLARLSHFRTDHPGMTYWQVLDFKTFTIRLNEGDVDLFGQKLSTLKDYFRRIHPDYLLPFLHWRTAALKILMSHKEAHDPMNSVMRMALPLQVKNGEYYWFSINKTVLQTDAEGRMVAQLHTFYKEDKWSQQTLRPVDFRVYLKGQTENEFNKEIAVEHSLMLIDEFTDAELSLMNLYAGGKTTDEVIAEKKWTRNTLHEYNANLLRKAKAIFVYDFRNARAFAEYCLEKGLLRLKA